MVNYKKLTYHIAEQSKLTSNHLCGLKLKESARCKDTRQTCPWFPILSKVLQNPLALVSHAPTTASERNNWKSFSRTSQYGKGFETFWIKTPQSD